MRGDGVPHPRHRWARESREDGKARRREMRIKRAEAARLPPITLDLDAVEPACAKHVVSDAYRDGWSRTFGGKA